MAESRGPIDCDVHAALPSLETLRPYLPDHWVDYLDWTNFSIQYVVDNTYPAWSPIVATPASDSSLEDVRTQVLGSASRAIVNCYAAAESILNPYLAGDFATAVNRWLQAEWLDREPSLLASAVIAPQHAEQAIAEIERIAADKRFVQLLLPARSSDPYGNQRYWPVWEAAARHGLVLGITYGGTTGAAPTAVNWLSSFFESYVLASQAFKAQMSSLTVCGVFDRWPDLRVAMMESGWAWVPGLLARLDAEWKANAQEIPWVRRAPSEYVRKHFRFTVQPTDAPPTRPQLEALLERIGGADLLMYGSDHPHRYGTEVDRLLDCLSADERERVLWRNAEEFYRLN